ncbi:unnamed protein product [Protopolystoma xenopodis]|uniref:Uncharacterized protein n=1 Tax=Protopolystoma xenopodis TaxID=117903 RepID=A0A3S5BV22_9PLAT|nr:unnamed protein product [Protopolystoma xenopodis]
MDQLVPRQSNLEVQRAVPHVSETDDSSATLDRQWRSVEYRLKQSDNDLNRMRRFCQAMQRQVDLGLRYKADVDRLTLESRVMQVSYFQIV